MKIIIIGGGIAGLAAGVYARLAGFEAEVYEKNPVVGGQCMGWNRQGLHIDNCIHWLTGTRPDTEMYRVWKTLGALDENTRYGDVTEFFTSVYQGRSATLWNDLERTRREFLALAPEDREEIEKFIQHTEYAKGCLFPAAKPQELMGMMDYIRMGKTMANMPKVMKAYGEVSLGELAQRFHNPVLRQLFGEYMPKDYTAYSFLVSYATMASENGKIPMGGSLAMTLRIRDKLLSLGGHIHTGKAVSSVAVEKGKAVGICLEDGARVPGDYVVSTVDTAVLFGGMLDPSYMPPDMRAAYGDEAGYPVLSGLQGAFALSGAFPYRGTVLFDCTPFHVGETQLENLSLKVYDYDPIYQKDGKTVLQCHIYQNHQDYRYWKGLSPEEYAAEKQRVAQLMAERIAAAFPQTQGKLECRFVNDVLQN